MRTIIATIIALTAITTTARAEDTDQCKRAMGHAEASAFEASRKQGACMDPDECRVARELVSAAVEQVRAAKALCANPADESEQPFDVQADPFEAAPLMASVPEYTGDDAAFRAVMGDAP